MECNITPLKTSSNRGSYDNFVSNCLFLLEEACAGIQRVGIDFHLILQGHGAKSSSYCSVIPDVNVNKIDCSSAMYLKMT